MKTLKLATVLSSILLLFNLTACKKDKKEAPVSAAVTTDDLLSYNIIFSLKDEVGETQDLKLMYFSKAGTEVTATLDGITSRRAQVVALVDNSFSFYPNSDAKLMYKVTFERDGSGKLKLKDVAYDNRIIPSYKLIAATIHSLGDLPSVKNKSYQSQTGVTLKFSKDTWTATSRPIANGTFYEISAGAWKGDLGGQAFMAVSSYENNQVTMYVQQDNVITPFKPI